jgi:hypothetical protein
VFGQVRGTLHHSETVRLEVSWSLCRSEGV